jgi:hypothetical protein
MSIDGRARTQAQPTGRDLLIPCCSIVSLLGSGHVNRGKERPEPPRTGRSGYPSGGQDVAQGARERLFCHVAPIRSPGSRSLASRLADLI